MPLVRLRVMQNEPKSQCISHPPQAGVSRCAALRCAARTKPSLRPMVTASMQDPCLLGLLYCTATYLPTYSLRNLCVNRPTYLPTNLPIQPSIPSTNRHARHPIFSCSTRTIDTGCQLILVHHSPSPFGLDSPGGREERRDLFPCMLARGNCDQQVSVC